jgi:hypothetical protein
MTTSIGRKGFIDVAVAGAPSPLRKVRLGTFIGRGSGPGDTGFIDAPYFRANEPPTAVIDLHFGRVVTASFGGVVAGGISQIDTGGLGADGTMSGHTMLAIICDTGAAGL